MSTFFRPFSYTCLDNPKGDLNTVPDLLKDKVGRDRFVADWHREEVIGGIPIPVVASPALLLVGSKELPHQLAAHELLCGFWPYVECLKVAGAGHDIMGDI